jgi:hypothetical protein
MQSKQTNSLIEVVCAGLANSVRIGQSGHYSKTATEIPQEFFLISLDASALPSVYLAHHEARTLDPGERGD